MKIIYKINRILLIINLILYVTVYLGLLFQIILGGFQIITTLCIYCYFNQLNVSARKHLITYSILTVFALTTLLAFDFLNHSNDVVQIAFLMVIPMSLAVYHLFITGKISRSWK